MKPFYVKAESINHEKQQELLDLAVDAGATLDEYRSCTTHNHCRYSGLEGDYKYFGVNNGSDTVFSIDLIPFGADAVEMTYDQAWEYVTGIIRAKESPMSREEAIEWLRENTTVEDWRHGDLIITGWSVERLLYSSSHHLKRDGETIEFHDVFVPHESPAPVAPATPRTPLFDRIKQVLGSRDVEIAGEDHLVGQVKGDAHKARILDKIMKEFNIYHGQEVVKTLKARLEVGKESPTPATPVSPKLDRSKPRNKYDHEIIPGVHVDVYDVLNAFPTGGADIDHAVKKLLQPGDRGHKDEITDCEEAIKSIQRRIDHIKEWGGQ